MVGGNKGEAKHSLNRDKYIKLNKMLFYENTLLLMNSDQSIFNDHRVDRKDDDKSEEYSKLKSWKTYGFIQKDIFLFYIFIVIYRMFN